jgi:RNA polymerase sigma factor (sigma-70 family)
VEEGPSDSQLLEAFLVRRDEVAFEALLHRHGPMVLGVCQRVLRNVHDAEDALQATFLVLARKASSIRSRQVVSSWLYGVAYRTAMKARVMNARRRTKERQAGERTRPQSPLDEELLEKLDHELSRLPDKYRVPVVLCELEGRSRKESARMLDIPEGTLSWRLAQAKKLLAKRLSRHEMAIPLGVLAVGLSPTLRASTLKTVLTTGAIPAQVLALTEGVIKAMLLSKLKVTTCAAALMLLAGVGASGLTYRATAQTPLAKDTLTSRSQTDDLEALRLEIEALRKSLQATRERVKTLEDEVSALKQQRRGPGAGMGGPPRGGMPGGVIPDMPTMPGGMGGRGGMRGGPMPGIGSRMQKEKADPVTDAENALKKLKENPGDKQATDSLAQALQRLLKERDKPNIPRPPSP